MKKIFLVVLISLLLTGCTVVRIDTKSIDNTINLILTKDNKLYNRVGKGYKYYVPRGVNYIDTDEFNEKLYSDGNYYYLYIDTVGYYYQTELNYTKIENAYYAKELDINNKKGYVQITEQDNKYYVQFMYNYAKVEAVVTKENINDVILNASYILSTVKFNNNVIKLLLDEDYFTNKEKRYDIFTPKNPVNNYAEELEK